jgi:hypothetical protein
MEVLEDAQRLVLRLVLTINALEAQSLLPQLAPVLLEQSSLEFHASLFVEMDW